MSDVRRKAPLPVGAGVALCAVDECESPRRTRIWCNKHYIRWWKHGDPTVIGRRSGRRPLTTEEQRRHTLRRMRISTKDYDALLADQGGGCAACGAPPGKRALSVDHDHKCCPRRSGGGHKLCGKCNRGLLCHNCNVALGHVKDDPGRLRALIEYLEFWNTAANAGGKAA